MTSNSAPALRWIWLGSVAYGEAWALQRAIALARQRDELDDSLLLLEHPPVYTMGRQGELRHLGDGREALVAAGAEYVEVDRGGSVTFHGPGQLVAYPIVRLADIFPIRGHPAHGDMLVYVRALEQALIETARLYGVAATRRPPYTGVWAGERKVAAIGVKVAGGITSHGVALNVCTDLSWYSRVIPCGIDGADVTSLQTLGVADVTPLQVAPVLAAALGREFGRPALPDNGRLAAFMTTSAQTGRPEAA